MKTYLNLGCGQRYHPNWTNLDFVATGPGVIAHNLLQGIPFPAEQFAVVYHSHVLEHFQQADGEKLMGECFRVLKPGGILRVAVPDLERIAREYLSNLEMALQGSASAQANYHWIMLEMYDQTVRSQSGGAMAQYLFQDNLSNEAYVFARLGAEGRHLRELHLNRKTPHLNPTQPKNAPRLNWRAWLRPLKQFLRKALFYRESIHHPQNAPAYQLGKFRLGGEIHQWMYDRFSLGELFKKVGFVEVQVCDAFSSQIPDWPHYELEAKAGAVLKPDSLFMEGIKPGK